MNAKTLLFRVDPLVLLIIGLVGMTFGLREQILWRAILGFFIGGGFLVLTAYRFTRPRKNKIPKGQLIKGPPSPPVFAHHPLPFTYCADCKRLFPGIPPVEAMCPRCKQSSSVTIVRSGSQRAELIDRCERSCDK